MDVVSMERTPAEKKAAEETMKPQMEGPDYPWGLCLNLGKDEMDKLGIEELPEPGDEFHVYAVCVVTNVHSSASESGDESKGITLQITAMGAMHEEEMDEGKGDPASILYGKAEKAEGE